MIRLALIGLGRMGRRWLSALRDSPRFEVVAIVDPVAPEATHRALIRCPRIDAAIVASPTEAHVLTAAGALGCCSAVLVEKPLAATYAEARDLLSVAQQADGRLVVGHVERFNPAALAFLAALRSGIVGAPVHVGAHRCGPTPEHVAPGNSAALDLAVHDLDLLRLALGPLRVDAAVGDRDTLTASLASQSGAAASVRAAWGSATKRRRLWCIGERGELRADLLAGTCDVDGRPLPVTPGDALAAQLAAFADLVETGDGGALATAEDGAETVRLVEEMVRISERRRAA